MSELSLTAVVVTLVVEAIIWAAAGFRAALARPSRRARLNLS